MTAMKWMLFAGYEDRESAERAFGELIGIGVAPKNLTLVTAAPGNPNAERDRALDIVGVGLARSIAFGNAAESPSHALVELNAILPSEKSSSSLMPIEVREMGGALIPQAATMMLSKAFGTSQKGVPGAAHVAGVGLGPSAQVVSGTLVLGDGALSSEVLTLKLISPNRSTASCAQAGLYKLGGRASRCETTL